MQQQAENVEKQEIPSRMDEFVAPQKPKKFTLPKCYIRNHHAHDAEVILDALDFEPTIITDTVTVCNNANASIDTLFQPSSTVTTERKKKKNVANVEKKRNPSVYNIFVKDTLAILTTSHHQLTSKERFSLAIKMWNDQKMPLKT